jgi:glycogen operon protein
VNFSIYCGSATAVTLLLFGVHGGVEPVQTIVLDPIEHQTFLIWHVYVVGLRPCAEYAFRVDGPKDLHGKGDRYNPRKVLLDPYARGNTATFWNRGAACGPDDNVATAMRSVVTDPSTYDWEGDQPLNRPLNESIIYEMHVGGFSWSPTAASAHPGTFAGVVEKIPHHCAWHHCGRVAADLPVRPARGRQPAT